MTELPAAYAAGPAPGLPLPEMTQKDLENTVLYPTAETLFGLGVRLRNDAVLNP